MTAATMTRPLGTLVTAPGWAVSIHSLNGVHTLHVVTVASGTPADIDGTTVASVDAGRAFAAANGYLVLA